MVCCCCHRQQKSSTAASLSLSGMGISSSVDFMFCRLCIFCSAHDNTGLVLDNIDRLSHRVRSLLFTYQDMRQLRRCHHLVRSAASAACTAASAAATAASRAAIYVSLRACMCVCVCTPLPLHRRPWRDGRDGAWLYPTQGPATERLRVRKKIDKSA